MDISGHYDFGSNTVVSNTDIEEKLKALVGSKGEVSVGSSNRGVPIVTIHGVDQIDELAVDQECQNVGKDIQATFIRAIDGGTIIIKG
ncbi:TPA: hypothetical protein ACPYV3_005432 [Citrobacter freundii]|uniref:Uncharacterized protein n=1 Tax=Citrobacter freundii TaxID=546 RepID=A0AAD2XZ96_CITFR|nr:hypothetical protein [Citrobacter freundii]EJG2171695.1 hypothetical protein [Citrobacter freundii 47N]AXZ47748.1 hypothetical protein AM363_12755 [Citrobacter freundii]EKQ7208781.1 hypothetical protein [Citrobacter freundii]EKT9390676.1 hypothetical protein [Citrobacter freundii]EKU0870349.1 hypothetical protein [Citrobacter freundii]